MVNRVGGLASGMDIDALVEKLMQAERIPFDKTFQQKQKFEWQRDAYRAVNAKLKTFDTFLFDKMIMSGSLNKKSGTSSNDKLVSVTASGSASGNLAIEGVSQLASSARGIGTPINADGNTRLGDLLNPGTLDAEGKGSISLTAIDANGRLAENATEIKITKDMTMKDLVKSINESGANVTALFENGQLSLTAKNSGSATNDSAEIKATGGLDIMSQLGFASANIATDGKNAIFKVNGITTERSSNSFTISGYNVTLKETFNARSTIREQVAAAQAELDRANGAIEALRLGSEAANEAYNEKNKIYEDQKKATFNYSLVGATKEAYDAIKNKAGLSKLSNTELDKISKLNLTNEDTLKQSLEDLDAPQKETLSKFSLDDLRKIQDVGQQDAIAMRDEAKIAESEKVYNLLNKKFLAGLTDEEIRELGTLSGEDLKSQVAANSILKEKFTNFSEADLKKLVDSKDELASYRDLAEVQVPREEALVIKNAEEKALENGNLRIKNAEAALANAKEAEKALGTGTESTVTAVTLTSTTDTQAMTDQIKEFVTKYNELIEGFNDQLKETKYRSYAPLTTEQRKDMSEHEQKIWDEKAKSGLLRSDSLLRDGMSNMRSSFMSPVAGLGDKMMDALAEIGITTSKDIKEGGKLVIDDKKLADAIAKDPDQVAKIFSQSGEITEKEVNGKKVIEDSRGIAERLRDAMKEMTINIEKTAGRSTMTDNQYSLGKKIVETDKRMSTLEARLKSAEARYWKQFSAMEQAINKANSQSSYFAQFSGQ